MSFQKIGDTKTLKVEQSIYKIIPHIHSVKDWNFDQF